MTRTSDTIGSHVDALSAGAGRLLAIRPMRAPLATPGMFDWTSGTNHWLLDVISPNSRGTATVIASFRQLVPDGRMKIHPGILRLLDAEMLKRWARGAGVSDAGSSAAGEQDRREPQKDVER